MRVSSPIASRIMLQNLNIFHKLFCYFTLVAKEKSFDFGKTVMSLKSERYIKQLIFLAFLPTSPPTTTTTITTSHYTEQRTLQKRWRCAQTQTNHTKNRPFPNSRTGLPNSAYHQPSQERRIKPRNPPSLERHLAKCSPLVIRTLLGSNIALLWCGASSAIHQTNRRWSKEWVLRI